MSDFPIKDVPIVKTQHCPNCETNAREAERWRVRAGQYNDECERMGIKGQAIIDQLCADNKRLQAEAKAQFDRGYYDGCANPIVRYDALRDALQHCADAIASWAKKPEGADPWLLGALDNALEALDQSK